MLSHWGSVRGLRGPWMGCGGPMVVPLAAPLGPLPMAAPVCAHALHPPCMQLNTGDAWTPGIEIQQNGSLGVCMTSMPCILCRQAWNEAWQVRAGRGPLLTPPPLSEQQQMLFPVSATFSRGRGVAGANAASRAQPRTSPPSRNTRSLRSGLHQGGYCDVATG